VNGTIIASFFTAPGRVDLYVRAESTSRRL
jgi:hypothetical protein